MSSCPSKSQALCQWRGGARGGGRIKVRYVYPSLKISSKNETLVRFFCKPAAAVVSKRKTVYRRDGLPREDCREKKRVELRTNAAEGQGRWP